MNYTPEQLDRLPKWAQLEIKRLERDLISEKEKNSQLEGLSETNTYMVDGMKKIPLPNNTHVDFIADGGTVSVYVRRDGNVDINADIHRLGDFAFMPRASNSGYLTFIKPTA